ncbi:MAG: hypothetical protein JSU86_20630 [Phycisphaerales bacterium]|nr:MAG: hypothetical protein JSU86_20630 [Phycisphaerales bacterium]
MRLRRFRVDSFDALRKRMIAETELALLVGLRFPDRMPRIPTMEVGSGRFHPDFATRYWSQTLEVDMAELAALEEACGSPRLVL